MSLFDSANNSAHDDITTTFDDEQYQQLISKLKKLDKSAQLIKILSVIRDINQANQLGDAPIERETITLSHNSLDADICLTLTSKEESNWQDVLSELNGDLYDNPEVNFTVADRLALENGDFELEFVKAPPLASLSLAELLDNMELYALGRPSTYANIISDLERSGVIEFNATTDSVKLTDKGVEIIAALKQLAPKLASATLSTQLQQQLRLVAAGFEMPKNVILSIVELIWDSENNSAKDSEKRDELADRIWLQIDDIYKNNDDIKGK